MQCIGGQDARITSFGSPAPMTTHTDATLVLSRSRLLTDAMIRQFSDRPTLRRVVSDLLVNTLKKQFSPPATAINLDHLKVNWTVDDAEQALQVVRQQSLLDAVLEHIALGTPVNYTFYEPQQCYLTQQPDGAAAPDHAHAFLPMTTVEQSIRQVLRDWVRGYQEALVDYWNAPVEGYRSRQHWLGRFFAKTLLVSANTSPELNEDQVDVLRQILKYPVLTDRLRALDSPTRPHVYFNQVQFNLGTHSVEHLLADLLVVYAVEGREQLLVCKPSGQIESFATLSAYGRQLGRRLSSEYPVESLTWRRYEADGDFLQTQAMIVLDTQLGTIAALDTNALVPRSVEQLERRLQQITDPVAIGSWEDEEPSPALARVYRALPEWLQNASDADRFAYRSHMIDLADVTRKAKGRVFDEGIPDLHRYASQVLHQQMLEDQPLAPGYNPDDIELDFIVASGPLGTAGLTESVTYSLTNLAVQNLIAMPSGHMTIRHKHNQLIQDWWMTPAYVKSLISRVDIGGTYPTLIKRLLMDDLAEAARREALYSDQLRVALPMQALESVLKGQGTVTAWGYRCVAALMQYEAGARVMEGRQVTICPLGMLSVPGAAPDFVRAMYIIGIADDPFGRCLLYRPLLQNVLIEYPSAQALLAAMAKRGALRDSVLHWLPDASRATHAAGVLDPAHPHVEASTFFYLRGMSSRFVHGLFRDSAMALVELADRQSVSNAESRWATFKEGGWLLLNTFAPLLRGPVAVVGWLLLTVSALKQDISALNSDDERSKAPAVIDLLFNIALVLLHIAQRPGGAVPEVGGELEGPPAVVVEETSVDEAPAGQPPLPVVEEWEEALQPQDEVAAVQPVVDKGGEPAPVKVEQGQVYFSDVPVGNRRTHLDYAWFNTPMFEFNQTQLTWLDLNRGLYPEQHQPVASGQYKGLYVIERKWHALVRGFSYEVSLEDEGVVVVSPKNPLETGPWLRTDGNGAWDFDLRMRLLGGGPQKRQESMARAAARKARVDELNVRFRAMNVWADELGIELNEALQRVEDVYKGQAAESLTYLEKVVRIKHLRRRATEAKNTFIVEHANFKERHALAPQTMDFKKDAHFNLSLLNLSKDILYSQHVFVTLFIELHPQFIEATHKTLAPEEVDGFISMRRELYNAQHLHLEDFREVMRRFKALRDSPRVGPGMAKEREKILPTIAMTQGQSRHVTELDFLSSHLVTLADIVPTVPFGREWHELIEIVWPLTYTLQSQAHLATSQLFSHSERVEIMEDIQERYARAYDGLEVLHLEVADQLHRADYNRLLDIIKGLSLKVEEQLAEELRRENEWLPAQPGPSRAGQQTSKIIRTHKHGILIGVARTSEHDTEVVEVGDPVSDDPQNRSSGPLAGRPKLAFRESSPNRWEAIEPPVAPAMAQTLGAIRTRFRTLMTRARTKIGIVDGYVKHSKNPVHLQEILDRDAQELEGLVRVIQRDLPAEPDQEKPKPNSPQSMLRQLREGAKRLRDHGVWLLKSLPPSTASVEALLEQGEVHLVKLGQRLKMFGPRNDYVQEYQVLNKSNQVLWYAHFHYPDLTSASHAPTAAHFKLKEQRRESKQSLEAKVKPGEKVPEVYYGKISESMITARVMPLEE